MCVCVREGERERERMRETTKHNSAAYQRVKALLMKRQFVINTDYRPTRPSKIRGSLRNVGATETFPPPTVIPINCHGRKA